MLIIFLIASTGFEYLQVDPVAGRACMGYAMAADGYSVNYNPAGLSISSAPFYSASYLGYIASTHFGYLGYENSQVGVGIKYFYSGSMKKTDALGNEYGSFSTNFIDLSVGKGFFINEIALGASLKFVYENIDSLFSLGAGIDVGAMYFFTDQNIQCGLALKNLGTTVKPFIEQKEALPYEIDLAVAKTSSKGWIGVDLVKPALIDIGVRLGGEYIVNQVFSVKASYSTLFSSMKTGNGIDVLTGLNFGFCVSQNSIHISYIYTPYFDLGGGHRVSLSIGG
jgi:hypothetical protein